MIIEYKDGELLTNVNPRLSIINSITVIEHLNNYVVIFHGVAELSLNKLHRVKRTYKKIEFVNINFIESVGTIGCKHFTGSNFKYVNLYPLVAL